MNCRALLEKQSSERANKPAFIFKGTTVTFGELKDNVYKIASALQARTRKGDKVAIYLPNSLEYAYSYLAIWCAGLTAVPLDFMLTAEELVSCMQHAEASVLIARGKPGLSLLDLKERVPSLKEVFACDACGDEKLVTLHQILRQENASCANDNVREEDTAIIFYTSGTTGRPKGVLVNYRQLEASPKAVEYFVNADMRDTDVAICALPFSHLGGLIFIQANLLFGQTVLIMERFMPLEFLRNIVSHKVNWFWLVPSMYYALLQLKEFERFDLSSLRWIVIFGAPSSADSIRRFHAHCPRAILYHGWGMTETNAPTTVIPAGSPKIESVGKPAPWIEVKVVDEEDRDLTQGAIGEIVVRGWVVTDGYYKDPELTAQTMRGGWFHTGDLGRFDEEGYLYIVGRKKEMIKVGGEIVFEPEIEAALHKHPDVAEAAVVGVPDDLRGEVPKAFVVLKPGGEPSEDALRQFLRGHLAHFKIPHRIEFVDALAKNRTGKIDKEKLRSR